MCPLSQVQIERDGCEGQDSQVRKNGLNISLHPNTVRAEKSWKQRRGLGRKPPTFQLASAAVPRALQALHLQPVTPPVSLPQLDWMVASVLHICNWA